MSRSDCLFHPQLLKPKLSECNAAAYFRVNEQFARELHKLLRRDDRQPLV